MLIDMHSPGVMLQPLYTLGGWRVNATFLDHVRVAKDRLMGQLNEGWRHVITTLGFERSALAPVGGLLRTADDLSAYMAERAAGVVPRLAASSTVCPALTIRASTRRPRSFSTCWMLSPLLARFRTSARRSSNWRCGARWSSRLVWRTALTSGTSTPSTRSAT